MCQFTYFKNGVFGWCYFTPLNTYDPPSLPDPREKKPPISRIGKQVMLLGARMCVAMVNLQRLKCRWGSSNGWKS